MKNYFQLCLPYRFEWNDVFALANFINTLLVIKFGLVASYLCIMVFFDALLRQSARASARERPMLVKKITMKKF